MFRPPKLGLQTLRICWRNMEITEHRFILTDLLNALFHLWGLGQNGLTSLRQFLHFEIGNNIFWGCCEN